VCSQVEVFATGLSLVQRSPTECVCMSLSVIRCNNNPVHLQRAGTRGQAKKERNEVHNTQPNRKCMPLLTAVVTAVCLYIHGVQVLDQI
jgi:hypothetical protein